MELYRTPPPLPPPPPSHSCGLYSSPPPPASQLPPDISPMDEVLSVLVNQYQTHTLSLPPKHTPPHLQLPPDIFPSDEAFSVLVNQHLSRAFSLPMNSPPPIPIDYLNDGDIKKCVISELSSSADSLIDKVGKISIINDDHFPEFTGSVTVSKGVVADSLIDEVGKISIIGGSDFPEFTGSVTVSKGVVDSDEHIDAGESDGYEADEEGSDSRDGDDNQPQGDGNDQFWSDADPNKANKGGGSSSSVDLEGNSEKSIRFYGIYRRNDPILLGKIYRDKVWMLNSFKKWEQYVRQCVAKLKVEGLPEHYDVVFERNIEQEPNF